jgi:sugar phosphate isomerase/epimerase
MSTLDDYVAVLDAVDSPANGATFCTGSLGVRADFDPVAFVEKLGHRIHFVHLRNTATGPARHRSARQFRGKRASGRATRTWSPRFARSWRKRRVASRQGERMPRSRCAPITAMICWTT